MKVEDNINHVIDHIRRFQRNSVKGMEDITKIWAYRFRDEVRRRAPKEAGYYASTIQVREIELKGFRSGFEFDVFTTHPAGHRLEYGFVGIDAIGRSYHDPPRPHWRPAEDLIMPQYREAIKDAVPRWWK